MAKLIRCPHCNKVQIPEHAPYCPSCGRVPRKGVSYAFIIVALLATASAGSFLLLINSGRGEGHAGRSRGPAASVGRSLDVGAPAHLVSLLGGSVYLARDGAFEELAAASASGDPDKLAQLARRGRAFRVPSGTGIVALRHSGAAYLVRITDGPDKGRQGWVEAESVKAD